MEKNKGILILGSIMLIGFFILMYYRSIKREELKGEGILINAKIVSIPGIGRTGQGIACKFKYLGDSIKLTSPMRIREYDGFKLIGKTFPAVYLPGTRFIQVLIVPKDFEEFGIQFPDSLNWTRQYE